MNTTTTNPMEDSKPTETKQIPTRELNLALMDIEDVMERAMCPYFLLGETARCVYKHEDLHGDSIEVGVLDTSLTKEVLSVFKQYIGEITTDLKTITYIWNGVTISIRIVKQNYTFLKNPQDGFYNFGDYKLPNSFEDYWPWRDKLE